MYAKRFLSLILCLTPFSAAAAGREGVALQEVRLLVEDCSQKVHSHKVELDILHEKLQLLEANIETLQKELGSGAKSELAKDRHSTLEKRVAILEKGQDTLISDLKTLKNHSNETSAALSACETRLSSIDKQLTQDIKSLKNSLQSMIVLLQKGETPSEKTYTVKPGDSLGKIAMDHGVEIKRLKELNQITHDRIYVGQKLQLP